MESHRACTTTGRGAVHRTVDTRRRLRSDVRHAFCALVLTIVVLIAGCGANCTSAHGGNPSTPPSTPVPTAATAAEVCPGGQNSMGIPNGAVVVQPGTANHSATARVGQPIEIELPSSIRWTYLPSQSATGPLTQQQPFGMLDAALHRCLWTWKAHTVGTAKLVFTGQSACPPNQQVCPQLAASPVATAYASATRVAPAGASSVGPSTIIEIPFTIHVIA